MLCNNLIELGDFDCIRICWGGRNCRLNRIVQIDAEHFVFRWPYSVSIVIYRMFISVGQVGNSFFKLDMCNKIRIEFLAHYRLLFKLLFQDLLKTPHFFNLNLAELSLALINCMYSVLLNFSRRLLIRVICLMFWELLWVFIILIKLLSCRVHGLHKAKDAVIGNSSIIVQSCIGQSCSIQNNVCVISSKFKNKFV